MTLRIALFAAAVFVIPCASGAQTFGRAPAGDAKTVAVRALGQTDHPCYAVKTATRLNDGTISATCDNRERYRVFTLQGEVTVFRCSVMEREGMKGC